MEFLTSAGFSFNLSVIYVPSDSLESSTNMQRNILMVVVVGWGSKEGNLQVRYQPVSRHSELR